MLVGLRTLHRRGQETDYVPIEEAASTVRGRILIGQTIRLLTVQPKRVHCTFDEMSADILSNQILKATLTVLLGEQGLDSKVRSELRHGLALLPGVRNIGLSARVFHEVRLHQSNRLYSFLINICRFFYESLEAQDRRGQYRFQDVDRDEKRMRRVFEKFVRNFLKRDQTLFDVRKERSDWFASAIEGSDLKWLPKMETDVTLRSRDRTIVIECKYTDYLFEHRFSSDKLRSSHLYQLCAYLRNLEGATHADRNADGILLYPTAGAAFDQSYRLQGHRVRVKTLDLNQRWDGIEREMRSLLRPICSEQSSADSFSLK